jgi:uncharacterized protein YkwD
MIGTIAIVQLIPVLLALAAAGGLGAIFGGCGSAVKDPNYPSDESWESSDADDVSGDENYAPEYEVDVAGDGISLEEQKLYELITEYRAKYKLPQIPLSKSLTLVANRHVRDLQENIGHLTHGWSDAPYDKEDPDTYPNMWKAPQRFNTGYPSNGYEIAQGGSEGYAGYRATAESSLEGWQGSPKHNAVILNEGKWSDSAWLAMGIGIYEGYAVVWFGKDVDPWGEPPREFEGVEKVQTGPESGSANEETTAKGSAEQSDTCKGIGDAGKREVCEGIAKKCEASPDEGSEVAIKTDAGEVSAKDRKTCLKAAKRLAEAGYKLAD